MTGEFSEKPKPAQPSPPSKATTAAPSSMKRFILPLLLVGIMVTTVGGIGFVIVKYAIDMANAPVPLSYDEMEKLQERDKVEDKEIPGLLACFEKNDEDLRVMAPITLAKVGKPAVEPLRVKLSSKNPKVRYCAVQTFGLMDPTIFTDAKDGIAVPDELVKCLDDPDTDVRRKAVYAVGRVGVKNEAAFNRVIDALSDKDPSVKETALEVLSKMEAPPKSALPALTRLAKGPDFEVRAEAFKVLFKMKADAIPAFKELLRDAEFEQFAHLAESLGDHAKEMKPLLPDFEARFLGLNHAGQRTMLVSLISRCGEDGAKVLARLFDTKEGEFFGRTSLAQTLGGMGPEARPAVPTLVKHLDPETPLRPVILQVLGEIGPAAKEAIPAVERLTNDPNVGPIARATLLRMGVKK